MNRIQTGSKRGGTEGASASVRHVMTILFVLGVSASAILEAWPASRGSVEEDADVVWLSDSLDKLSVHVSSHLEQTIPLLETGGVFWNTALPKWNCVGLRRISFDSSVLQKGFLRSRPSARKGREEAMCLWVHPSNRGDLVLQFKDLPAWSSFDGCIYFLNSADPKASFDMVAEVNGDSVVHLAPPTTPGQFLTFQSKPEGGVLQGNSLTFRFGTLKKGKNHICMDVRLTPMGQAGGEN